MLDRLNTGERILGAGGLALLISLWLPWFGTKEEDNPAIPPAREVTINAWESFDVSDVLILLVALGAIAVVVAVLQALVKRGDDRPLLAVLAGSLVVTGLVFARIEEPLTSTSTRYGIWIGLLAALAIAVGAWIAREP